MKTTEPMQKQKSQLPLTPAHPMAEYLLGETTVRYTLCDRTGIVEFSAFPSQCRADLVEKRKFSSGTHIDGLPARWKPQYAHEPEWLVQFKIADTPSPQGHQCGRSMRGSEDLNDLSLVSHAAETDANGAIRIITTLSHAPSGGELRHLLDWRPGDPFFNFFF